MTHSTYTPHDPSSDPVPDSGGLWIRLDWYTVDLVRSSNSYLAVDGWIPGGAASAAIVESVSAAIRRAEHNLTPDHIAATANHNVTTTSTPSSAASPRHIRAVTNGLPGTTEFR